MQPKTYVKIGNYLSYFGTIFPPIAWILLLLTGTLYTTFGPFTLYTWMYCIAWYAVVLVMIIRPISDFFPKNRTLKRLCIWRRGVGILSAMIILTILVSNWIMTPSLFLNIFTIDGWNSWDAIIARLSEVTTVLLLITSNTYSQKLLKRRWKTVQRTSYIYFITGGLLSIRYGDDYGVRMSMTIVILCFSIAAIKNYLRKKK